MEKTLELFEENEQEFHSPGQMQMNSGSLNCANQTSEDSQKNDGTENRNQAQNNQEIRQAESPAQRDYDIEEKQLEEEI